MDYEKKYKEALERARIYRDNAKAVEEYSAVARYENIFPELRENEDEKIRKEIIEYLTVTREKDLVGHPERQRWITYLEKKKEQKPKNILTDDDSLQTAYLKGQTDVIEDPKAYGLQKEQNPAEWSEEDKDYYDTIVRKLEVIGDDSGLSSNQIKFLREHCPLHRSEWSEEDETIIEGACSALEIHGHTKLASMLKSLRPQPKQEWGKDDKEMLDAMIDIVSGSFYEPLCPRKEMLAWLKSLRPSWKPSEEQIGALNYAYCELFKREDVGHNILGPLQKLLDDLNKLM